MIVTYEIYINHNIIVTYIIVFCYKYKKELFKSFYGVFFSVYNKNSITNNYLQQY